MFSALAGIILLSLRNGEGAFDTVCLPLVCKWGQLPPLPSPAPPPMMYTSNSNYSMT